MHAYTHTWVKTLEQAIKSFDIFGKDIVINFQKQRGRLIPHSKHVDTEWGEDIVLDTKKWFVSLNKFPMIAWHTIEVLSPNPS